MIAANYFASEAYYELLKYIPQDANNSNRLVSEKGANHSTPLNWQDYPHVKYWFKRNWSQHQSEHADNSDAQRGRGRAAKGINVSMRYVEYENGEMISGDRATEIRRFARSIWVLLAKKGIPPATWGAADIETRKLYSQEMCTRFPELKLCDLDWKSEQIATDNYPSWHNTWDSKTTQQIERDNSLAPGSGSQTKRVRGESTAVHSKRAKVQNADDASIKQGMPVETAVTANLPPAQLTVDDTSVAPVSLDIIVAHGFLALLVTHYAGYCGVGRYCSQWTISHNVNNLKARTCSECRHKSRQWQFPHCICPVLPMYHV